MQVMPIVQWAINAAYRERYQTCPFKMVFRRKTPLKSSENDINVERLDPTRVQPT